MNIEKLKELKIKLEKQEHSANAAVGELILLIDALTEEPQKQLFPYNYELPPGYKELAKYREPAFTSSDYYVIAEKEKKVFVFRFTEYIPDPIEVYEKQLIN